jgi:6-phosphogluconate dehydrogenase
MQIHYIGLGKMGLNMVERMVSKGHTVTAFDIDTKALKQAQKKGARAARSLEELMDGGAHQRVIWVMVPFAVVEVVLQDLEGLLRPGDVIIEGGNSPYMMSRKRAERYKAKGIGYLDIGVSGGPEGALYGACMMVGGAKKDYAKVEPLLKDLCVKDGLLHAGASGAGHYVKMIHNGIEYGMMQAIAEGFSLMHQTDEFKLNAKAIASLFNHGSVVESRLMDWLHQGYEKYGNALAPVSGTAIGTGEGGWTVATARELKIPVKVIEYAFKARKESETNPNYQAKIIMAIRNGFGGHAIK